MIFDGGDWLCGGDLEVLRRIYWNDGLDKYRLTPKELRVAFRQRNVSDELTINLGVHTKRCSQLLS